MKGLFIGKVRENNRGSLQDMMDKDKSLYEICVE